MREVQDRFPHKHADILRAILPPMFGTDIVCYFELMRGRPEFAGYDFCAREVIHALGAVDDGIDTIRSSGYDFDSDGDNASNIVVPLILKPFEGASERAQDVRALYADDPQEGAVALRELFYSLTDAQFVEGESEVDGYQLLRGLYNGQIVYFLETYSENDHGKYMTWDLYAFEPTEQLQRHKLLQLTRQA